MKLAGQTLFRVVLPNIAFYALVSCALSDQILSSMAAPRLTTGVWLIFWVVAVMDALVFAAFPVCMTGICLHSRGGTLAPLRGKERLFLAGGVMLTWAVCAPVGLLLVESCCIGGRGDILLGLLSPVRRYLMPLALAVQVSLVLMKSRSLRNPEGPK
jgi:hypothetical protein